MLKKPERKVHFSTGGKFSKNVPSEQQPSADIVSQTGMCLVDKMRLALFGQSPEIISRRDEEPSRHAERSRRQFSYCQIHWYSW